jgi:predicted enzyme related to lactoylglutathione lyase
MPSVSKHKPGAFCWFELTTTNQAEARTFYQALFGWSADDSPIGPNDFYTTFSVPAGSVGAAYTMRKKERDQGVPPHWLTYVTVQSADAAAKKAAELGGTAVAPPFDVMDFGRMSVVQDPAGGMLAVWEAKAHHGAGAVHEPGSVVWVDLSTPDQPRAGKFYGDLFGWKMTAGKNEVDPKAGDYFHIVNDGDFIGGIPPAEHRNPQMPAHWLIYVSVPEATAAIAKAESFGGRLLHGPVTIEGARTFAVLADPQGAVFAVVDGKD